MPARNLSCLLVALLLTLLAGATPAAWAQVQTTALQAKESTPPSPAAPAPKGGFTLEDRAPISAEVQDTLQRINAYRAAGATCGAQRFEPAPPLAWQAQLEQAAAKHAQDMATRRSMSHTGADGSSVSERVSREAYAWARLGENVSAGYASVPAALAGWMKSPGHCSNIMTAGFAEVGVAGANAPGDNFGWYRTMVLGSPRR